MLDILYPFSYFASLIGLILWFYFKENNRMSRTMSQLFLGGFFVYLFSLAFSSGAFPYKLLILFRDLMVLGLVAQFFSFFRKNKLVFFVMLAVLFGAFQFKGRSILEQTFPEKISSDILLDENGELLVEIKDGHQLVELSSLLQKYNLQASPAFQFIKTESTDLDDYIVVNVPEDKLDQLEAIKTAFNDSGLSDWVEENEQIAISPIEATRRAPKTKKKYGIDDPNIDQLWGFEAMQVDELYRYLKESKIKAQKKAKIFILDTGVDAQHEDIKGNYFSTRSKYDKDGNRHGTHCAGIAASVSNNSLGIASLSPSNEYVEVSSIQVLSSFGGGTQKRIINGILEAADNQADVISLSLGGRSNSLQQRAYAKAVKYANDAGAIVVVAAGNSNMNAKQYAPANTPGVITVSAVDTVLNRASFSNFVNDIKMGIAAPGVAIYSTIPGNKYEALNGTSMATPYVAGLLGLMKSIQPSLTTKQAYVILKQTGKATGNVSETGRLIMPAKAVKALAQ